MACNASWGMILLGTSGASTSISQTKKEKKKETKFNRNVLTIYYSLVETLAFL